MSWFTFYIFYQRPQAKKMTGVCHFLQITADASSWANNSLPNSFPLGGSGHWGIQRKWWQLFWFHSVFISKTRDISRKKKKKGDQFKSPGQGMLLFWFLNIRSVGRLRLHTPLEMRSKPQLNFVVLFCCTLWTVLLLKFQSRQVMICQSWKKTPVKPKGWELKRLNANYSYVYGNVEMEMYTNTKWAHSICSLHVGDKTASSSSLNTLTLLNSH